LLASSPRKSKKVKRVCKQCGKEFFVYLSGIKERAYKGYEGAGNFCNRGCVNKYFKHFRLKSNNPIWKGGEARRICENCNNIFYVPKVRIKIGYAKFCSNKCRYKYLRGKNHQSWKGGERLWKKRDASSSKYKNWRAKIFKRDNWTCQLCKDRSRKGHNVILEGHHLKSWKNYPKLRYTLYNGITLCHECHLSN